MNHRWIIDSLHCQMFTTRIWLLTPQLNHRLLRSSPIALAALFSVKLRLLVLALQHQLRDSRNIEVPCPNHVRRISTWENSKLLRVEKHSRAQVTKKVINRFQRVVYVHCSTDKTYVDTVALELTLVGILLLVWELFCNLRHHLVFADFGYFPHP